MNNARKLIKTDDEFDFLRNHILNCPYVSKDGKAMQAALNGLDQERKRQERDAKLLAKFTQKNAGPTGTVSVFDEENANLPDDVVQVTRPRMTQQAEINDKDEELMEWHDIPKQELDLRADEGSLLGQQLAAVAISNLATAQTTIGTPLAAIALALHAALRSSILNFTCTGIPEKGPVVGFAPPVRELPKAMFVPNDWDECSTEIFIRYRKNGIGSVILGVTEEESVQVKLVPTNCKEPPATKLEFPLSDYVNMDSLPAALRKDRRVFPALHYKNLEMLMTSVCNAFDLGTVHNMESASETPLWDYHIPYVDTTIRPLPDDRFCMPESHPTVPLKHQYSDHESPTIQVFEIFPRHGDFAGDLNPTGINPLGPSGGNLMGPDHPMFGGSNHPSGFGMKPRYDPFGPPGGPQDPNNLMDDKKFPRLPPGGLGIPNNDIARPPNDLSNNMFM